MLHLQVYDCVECWCDVVFDVVCLLGEAPERLSLLDLHVGELFEVYMPLFTCDFGSDASINMAVAGLLSHLHPDKDEYKRKKVDQNKNESASSLFWSNFFPFVCFCLFFHQHKTLFLCTANLVLIRVSAILKLTSIKFCSLHCISRKARYRDSSETTRQTSRNFSRISLLIVVYLCTYEFGREWSANMAAGFHL